MSVTPMNIISTELSTTSTVVFTAPAGTTVITTATLCPPSGGADVTLTLTKSGGSALSILASKSLTQNYCSFELSGLVLSEGDTLSANGSVASVTMIVNAYNISA